MALPYGVYDMGANAGWVTWAPITARRSPPSRSAAGCGMWPDAYLNATWLLVTADSGGSDAGVAGHCPATKVVVQTIAATTTRTGLARKGGAEND